MFSLIRNILGACKSCLLDAFDDADFGLVLVRVEGIIFIPKLTIDV
jgi:hypothetical protein